MTLKHILAAAATALLAVSFTACDGDLDRPPLDIPHTTWQANTSILDLKTSYWQADRNFATEIVSPVPGRRVIIGGRVIASDSTGNIYKTVYLQDSTSAVAIAVDTTKLYLRYKQGEEMFFDVTGLYAGKYNGLFQIGEREAYGTGYETAQMAGSDFYNRSRLNGLPDEARVDTIVTTLDRIRQWGRSQDSIARYVGQLIRLDNVAFEGGGSLTWADFGANTNRTLIDGRGNSLTVRNSAYATFAQMTMPAGTGSVVCILSYYGTDWQLLMRSQTDAFGFSGDPADIPGAKPSKYTYSSSGNFPEDGVKFIMVTRDGRVVVPIKSGYTYGYLNVTEPIATEGTVEVTNQNNDTYVMPSTIITPESNEFNIEKHDRLDDDVMVKDYAILDSYGRYLAMDNDPSHKSFQLYDTYGTGCSWRIIRNDTDSNYRFYNYLRGYYICWSAQYDNFAPSEEFTVGPWIYVRED